MVRAAVGCIFLISLLGFAGGCASVLVEESDLPMLYQPLLVSSPGEIAELSVPEPIESLTVSLDKDPHNLMLLERRGWALARSGAYEMGIADFDRGIEIAEEEREPAVQARLLCRRGIVYREARKLSAAIDSYTAAIEIDGENWEFYFHRWQALRQVGRSDEAEADRQVGLQLCPDVFEGKYSMHCGII